MEPAPSASPVSGPRTRRPSRRTVIGAAVAAAALSALPHPAQAAPGTRSRVVPPLDPKALRAAIDDLRHPRVTAAQLRIGGPAGSWYGASGAADIQRERSPRSDDRVRIGSVSKAFVATVLLQLAAERRVSLDATVQRCLPGLLPDRFAPITPAQLLDHTSGLPDSAEPEPVTPEEIVAYRHNHRTPGQIVAAVSGQRAMKFRPGTKQEYRGINYVLAALVIERVTGRPYGREIGSRIVRPLGLHGTSVPGDDPLVHGPRVHGYVEMSDGTLRDITRYNQGFSWGEGEMISTAHDLDRFVTALYSGALLPPDMLDRMFTLPAGVKMLDGSPARYGQGLQTGEMNGVTLWGKSGWQYGYNSGMLATRDLQRRLVFSFSPTRQTGDEEQMTQRIVKAATAP
ncbi:serine hydrolase domain-containing protein [Streptomyces sp. NBC_00344]|uniref:serine hydrolase domain-containing protein n=1 Tax=Streptomyces sp. NBC_00344 TaxID=2975720 RepID=UPI002E1E4BA0